MFCAKKGKIYFHSINWLPFATSCTVMLGTLSGAYHSQEGGWRLSSVYWNICRFSQLTFPKLLASLLCAYEGIIYI
jgi:hypothetical protein